MNSCSNCGDKTCFQCGFPVRVDPACQDWRPTLGWRIVGRAAVALFILPLLIVVMAVIGTHVNEGREAWERPIRTGETVTLPFGTHDPTTFYTETSIGTQLLKRDAAGAHVWFWDGKRFVPVQTKTVWVSGEEK